MTWTIRWCAAPELRRGFQATEQGWPDVAGEIESAADYQQRAVSGFDPAAGWSEQMAGGASGRRTEVTTGVYLVRQAIDQQPVTN